MDNLPIPPSDITTSSDLPDASYTQSVAQEPNKPFHLNPLIPILIIAIFISTVAGAVIRKNSTPTPSQTAVQQQIPTPVSFFLSVDQAHTPVTAINGEILVSGKTLPDSTVLIYTDMDETSVESDAQGKFEDSILVGENGGLIRITAYSEKGEEISKTVAVGEKAILSYAQNLNVLGKSDSNSGKNEQKSETSKESNKNEIIKEVKKEAATERSGSPIKQTSKSVIKNETETVVDETTDPIKFIKEIKETKKIEKIGKDKIKAILEHENEGTESSELRSDKKEKKNENDGTESAELISGKKLQKMETKEATEGAELKRHAVMGVLTSMSGESIALSHQTQQGRTFTIYYNANTVISIKDIPIATISDLKLGMRIAAVGTPIDNGLLANHIHVIPGKAIGVFGKHPLSSPSGSLTTTPSATLFASPTSSIIIIESTLTPSP